MNSSNASLHLSSRGRPLRQRTSAAGLLLLSLIVGGGSPFGRAADKAPPAEPSVTPPLRELWVPTEHLKTVLDSRPRAVVLTPEQYQALMRDAIRGSAEPEPELAPPVAASISKAELVGILGDEVVSMTASYVVESFSDEWQEIPLTLPLSQLGQITVNDESALRVVPPPKGKKQAPKPVLAIRGKGSHTVSVRYHLPVTRSPSGNAIQIQAPGVAANRLVLHHSDGVKFESPLPFRPARERTDADPQSLDTLTTEFVLPARAEASYEIGWTARAIAAIPDAAIFQTCQYLYSIDSTRIQADLGLVLSASLADLPRTFTVSVPPGVRVLSVEGSELLRWTRNQGDGALSVFLTSGKRQAADLRILAEADVPKASDGDAEDIVLTLPIAEIEGVHRASGTIAILGSDDVRVKNISTGPLMVPAPEAVDPTLLTLPEFVTGFQFPVTTTAPEVTLSPLQDRFNAQMDTRIELKREAIHLSRQISLTVIEGRLFTTEFELPDGEELVSVTPGADTPESAGFSWTQVEGENRIRLLWQSGLSTAESAALTVVSRRDPTSWFSLGETPADLAFENAAIPQAESVSGYVAVAFDESFRVETGNAENLEPRDGRTTPVTGTLAWFRLSDYSLQLSVARRPTEIEANVTAYALPLQSTLEIEGQIDLLIRYTPISEIVIGVDPAIAEQLRFESPLLAEKRLDEESGQWTLTFHDEQQGQRRLRFRMALPFEMKAGEENPDGPKSFNVTAPTLSIPSAKRIRGDWVIEANTDTELSFDAGGLDAVDSLRVPTVEGYLPRHRVIAAFQYRGDEWTLDIAGTRHVPEDLVTTVIDSLTIDTVVSTDGDDRHQAVIQLRTSGEQFLEVGLPDDAQVWTLTVDGMAVKPVRADPGTLRVQLPAREGANQSPISLKFVYQTPGKKWRGSGKENLQPIRLAGRIPITRSQWRLHLPDGFDYQRFRSNLQESFEIVDRTLLGQAWRERDRFFPDPPAFGMIAATFEADGAMPEGAAAYDSVFFVDSNEMARRSDQSIVASTMPETEAITATGAGGVEARLSSIIVPNVEFEDMALDDALAYLEEQARLADPTGRGVDIQIPQDLSGTALNLPGSNPTEGGLGDTAITLKLTNVPLSEALRYTTALANLKYKVNGDKIAVLPISTPDSELATRTFVVPPNFLANATQAPAAGGGGGMADPFAAAPEAPVDAFDADSPAAASARSTARGILESYGVDFGSGSAATYNPETGQLIVRNTPDQLELVEALNSNLSVSNDPVPTLDDMPVTGRLFSANGTINVGGALIQPMEELVDSENGDRLTIHFSGGTEAVNGGIGGGASGIVMGGGSLGAANDLVIDQLDLQGIPLAEAVTALESKIRELSQPEGGNNVSGGYAGARPVELFLDADGDTARQPVNVQLRNITLGEALARLTENTNTEFRTTASGVVIAQPNPIPLDQLSTLVLELPNSAFENPDNQGQMQRQSARGLLSGAGIEFPPGTSAAYNFATRRLAVRNTPDALEQVRAVFSRYLDEAPMEATTTTVASQTDSNSGFSNGLQLKGFDPRNAGLIPIDFALPESGRSYVFTGLYAPEPIRFRYVNWERQVRLAWVWMLVGGLAFWCGAYRKLGRPVLVGLLGIIVLTFTPLVLSKTLLGFCNSLLIGWIAAALLWILWRICDRVSRGSEAEASAEPAEPTSTATS